MEEKLRVDQIKIEEPTRKNDVPEEQLLKENENVAKPDTGQ
jgi:hypothetical protein